MNKPFTLLYAEYTKEITEVANKYVKSIPATIQSNFLTSLAKEFEKIAEIQYQQDKKAYEESLEKEN